MGLILSPGETGFFKVGKFLKGATKGIFFETRSQSFKLGQF